MKQARILPRSTILEWLLATPGLTNRDIAARSGYLVTYITSRMQMLEQQGFLRREVEKAPVGRPRIRWYAREDHPPVGRKTRRAMPKPREHLVRQPERPQGVGQQLVRVCRAPDHDSSIVAQALAAVPALQAAWMGMGA